MRLGLEGEPLGQKGGPCLQLVKLSKSPFSGPGNKSTVTYHQVEEGCGNEPRKVLPVPGLFSTK